MRGAKFGAMALTVQLKKPGLIPSTRYPGEGYTTQLVSEVSKTAAFVNAMLISDDAASFTTSSRRAAIKATREAYERQLFAIFGGLKPWEVLAAGAAGKVVSWPLVAALWDAALAHAEAVDDAISAPTKTEAFQQELGKTAADLGKGVGAAGKGLFEGFTGVPVWLALAIVLLVVAQKAE
jgi:hypothetical protein